MKLRLSELETLQFILRQLSKKTLTCGYHISYNLRIVDKIVSAETDAMREEFKRLCDKDENGENLPWLRKVGYDKNPEDSNNYVALTPDNKDDEELKNPELWIQEPVLRITDKENFAAYEAFKDEAYNTEHEVSFKVIPEDKLENANIEAEWLMPLYGTILEDVK